jgi:hypothetical protein
VVSDEPGDDELVRVPLGDRATMAGSDGIRLALRTATNSAPNLHGAYDLDERFFSGGKQPVVRCLGLLTRSDVLQSDVDASTLAGGFTFVAGNGTPVTLPATDAQDPGGVYTPVPFSLFKSQSGVRLPGGDDAEGAGSCAVLQPARALRSGGLRPLLIRRRLHLLDDLDLVAVGRSREI